MRKWITKVIQEDSRDSVSKAREDVFVLARAMDYHPIYIYRYEDRNENQYALHSRIDGITAGVFSGDLLIYQYPSYNGLSFDRFFLARMKERGIYVSLFIHDIEYLRGAVNKRDEIELFNLADSLVIHGEKMKEILYQDGVTTPMIKKELFDYLHASKNIIQQNNWVPMQLIIAGNLNKSVFLSEWNQNTPLLAFGDYNLSEFSENVFYQGSYTSEELIYKLPQNSFGLAWDTNLSSGGNYGEYTRYNAPHKISLYLSIGIPVIVWEYSGIASFVKKYNVGFTINNLEEIDQLLSTTSLDKLKEMRKNAIVISRQLRNGIFTRKSLLSIELKILEADKKGDFE